MRIPKKPRRGRLWSWRKLIRMLKRQGRCDIPDDELEAFCKNLARELNRMDYQSRYREWSVRYHERLCGLAVIERDYSDRNNQRVDHEF